MADIASAPFDRDLELAVIDADGEQHALSFYAAACFAAG